MRLLHISSLHLDIDECSGTNDCHADANCTDNDGSYECDCDTGYTGNGTFCDSKSLSS